MAKTLTDRQRADRGELSGEISPHDQSGALADRFVGQEMIVGACDSVCLSAHKVAERVRVLVGFRSLACGKRHGARQRHETRARIRVTNSRDPSSRATSDSSRCRRHDRANALPGFRSFAQAKRVPSEDSQQIMAHAMVHAADLRAMQIPSCPSIRSLPEDEPVFAYADNLPGIVARRSHGRNTQIQVIHLPNLGNGAHRERPLPLTGKHYGGLPAHRRFGRDVEFCGLSLPVGSK